MQSADLLRVKHLILLIILIACFFIFPGRAFAICSVTYGSGGSGGSPASAGGTGGSGVGGECATTNSGGGGGGAGGGSAAGGTGGNGAGGGLVLDSASGSTTISGTIDARGGGSSATNGGTVKVFYTGSAPATGGISAGRVYTNTNLQSVSCTPITAADDSSTGTIAWANPTKAEVQDGTNASAGPSTSGNTITHYLKLTGCSFSVPSTVTITGVGVGLYKYGTTSDDSSSAFDNSVNLVKGGTIQATNRALGGAWPVGTPAWVNYGGASDLWGTALTPADVNASNFGVVVSATLPYAAGGCSIVCIAGYNTSSFIDASTITIYYEIYVPPTITNSAPSAPTLVSPSNGATGMGLKPTLQLRSSDADNDYLDYKIQLCQDSGCSTVLQTFDQTSSQTGWSGQDANSNNAYVGSSTLSSSTIASYTQQSSLTQATTYYWRAYAIDPGGTNGFGSASSIQSFTTGANSTPAPPVLVSPSSGAVGQSTGPLLQIRSSDADGDYLRYKIIIYNSDCSTNPQTFDQTSSQTGWSGQDQQSGTAYAGNSILGNSTIATYGSASLSASTQYCWKAAAIDPGGTNSWSAFSGTQLFTTGSASGQVQLNGNTQIRGGTLVR